MSIDFGTDIYEEPLVSKSFLPEDSGELSLRPHTLREYIGQQKAKENLSVFIEAARRRTEPLDHVLLHGPPGLGKTTLAGIIAAEMGVNIRITSVSFYFSTGHLTQLEQEELQNFVLPRLEPFGIWHLALLLVGSEEFPEFTRLRLPVQ